jgi:amino acid transporter
MGTALLFGADVEASASSAGFAAQLVTLFVEAVGGWIRPVIGIAALAVMFSTVLAVVDGFPRVYANVIKRLFGLGMDEQRLYVVCLLGQAAVALVLLLAFLASFGAFIDFATTAGFVAAPVIAYLNHRVIHTLEGEGRPPRWLGLWSAVGVAVLTIVSVSYLVFRFG